MPEAFRTRERSRGPGARGSWRGGAGERRSPEFLLDTLTRSVAEAPPDSSRFQMGCWQNGVRIVSEQGIDAYRLEDYGLTLFPGPHTPAGR